MELCLRSGECIVAPHGMEALEGEGWPSGGSGLEEAVAAEVPEHAHLNGSLQRLPVFRRQVGGFMEGDNSVLVLGEDPVEDDEVVVKVGVQAGAEPVQERDRLRPAQTLKSRSAKAAERDPR